MPVPIVKVTTTIKLEQADYRILEEIAVKEVRPVGNLIEYVLKKFIQDYQKKQ